MAASVGRRVGILASQIRSYLCETLAAKGQQQRLGASYPSAASHIGVAPAASILGTAGALHSQERRDFATELKGIGGLSIGAAVWRKFEVPSQCGRGLVRNASTFHLPDEALKEGAVPGEGPQTKEEAKAAEDKEEEEEVVDEKTQLLRVALSHVPKLGWTEAALVAGAKDLGLSPAFVGAFPRKEAALVEFFMDECTHALVEELETREEELGKLVMQDRIATIVWVRLQMQVPFLPKWAQALSIQANPVNLSTTITQRALLMDEIWHAAGDRSTDVDWYTKRAVLAGVYSTTELYMITDISPGSRELSENHPDVHANPNSEPVMRMQNGDDVLFFIKGFKDTQAFLERRISDALDCRKTAQEATHLVQAIGAGLQKTVDSFLNRTKRPPPGFGF